MPHLGTICRSRQARSHVVCLERERFPLFEKMCRNRNRRVKLAPCLISALFLLAFIVEGAKAQDSFLGTPTRIWETTIPPMGQGNAIVAEPDNQAIHATSSDGTISSLNPDNGTVVWNYQPRGSDNSSAPLACNGGIDISNDKKFMIYSVTENRDSDEAIWYVV